MGYRCRGTRTGGWSLSCIAYDQYATVHLCCCSRLLYFSLIRWKVCLVGEMLRTKLLMTWALYLYPTLKHEYYGLLARCFPAEIQALVSAWLSRGKSVKWIHCVGWKVFRLCVFFLSDQAYLSHYSDYLRSGVPVNGDSIPSRIRDLSVVFGFRPAVTGNAPAHWITLNYVRRRENYLETCNLTGSRPSAGPT